MGIRDDTPHSRGATSESINALPSYKFKSKRQKSRGNSDFHSHSSGGILAAGTDEERTISAEDAVSALFAIVICDYVICLHMLQS